MPMRLFEIVLIVLLLGRTLLTLTSYQRGKNWRTIATFTVCAGLIAHLFLEGWRWQMIPFYLAAFAALTVDLTRLPSKLEDLEDGRSVSRTLSGVAILAVLSLIPGLFPVPRLVAPTGEYLVGSLSFELEDGTRAEPYAEITNTNRRVIVRVWYPATTRTKAAPWIEDSDEMLPIMASSAGLPGFMLGHLRHTRAHSFWEAPIEESDAPYPVVFFEHGLWGHRAQNTFLVEDLASHGYVVFAVEHPYGALHTIFSDGSTASYHDGVLPESSDPDYDAAAKRLTAQWAEDVGFTLDYLAGNPAARVKPIADAIDTSQVGLAGHSTGGASTLSFCQADQRCKVALVLDPWMQAASEAVLNQGLKPPVLSFFSDLKLGYFEESNQERYQQFIDNDGSDIKTFFVENTGHHDFDDTALLSPVARFLGHSKGSLPANRSFAIVRDYSKAQFDKYLLGSADTILEAEISPYSELERAYDLSDKSIDHAGENVPVDTVEESTNDGNQTEFPAEVSNTEANDVTESGATGNDADEDTESGSSDQINGAE